MEGKKTGRFTFRTTEEDERILNFICQIEGMDRSKIIRKLFTGYGISKGYLLYKYVIPGGVYER